MNTILPSLPKAPPVETSQSVADSGASAAAAPHQGFADAMHTAAGKPARKSASSKSSEDRADGGKSPAAGNVVPPVLQPLPPAVTAAAQAAAAQAAAAQAAAAALAAAAAQAAAAQAAVTGPTAAAAQAATAAVSGAIGATPGVAGTKAITGTAAARVASAAEAANSKPSTTAAAQADLKPATGLQAQGALDAAGSASDHAAADADDVASAGADATLGGKSQDNATTGALAAAVPVVATAADYAVASTAKLAPAHQSWTPHALAATPRGADAASNGAAGAAAGVPANDVPAAPAPTANPAVGSSVAGIAAEISASAGVSAQNSEHANAAAADAAAASDAEPAQAAGPDAASALAAAGASATAAAVAGAARVMTTLAAGTAIDEKHLRPGDVSTVAATPAADIDGSAAAGAAQAAAGTTSQSADVPSAMKISAHIDSSEFGQGLANQISTMVDKNISSAKLQVNPAALGPIEVRISVQGDNAQVWMVSHSAATRDALHASTATLRDMLGNQGFGQVSVDISQRSFQDRTPTPQTYQQQNSDTERRHSTAPVSTVDSVARLSSGALDAYA